MGLDVPWDGRSGFAAEGVSAPLRSFLGRQASQWSHAFFSWQPRDRARPVLEDYAPAWDELMRALPSGLPRALHHTALNLASLDAYDQISRRVGWENRRELLSFTRQLIERYDLQWVNEDVGFWSLDGRAVPYPLPPLLTAGGLAATVRNTRECQDALPVPLLLEFPGFSEGASVVVGDLHAYDFFRRLAEATDAPVTLDVGHLLSYQWWRGVRGRALFDELERLPLEHCFELHLSGCEISGQSFIDAHHGVLLDEQYELTARLMARCPNLRAITWEDPRFDEHGELTPSNAQASERLKTLVSPWLSEAPREIPLSLGGRVGGEGEPTSHCELEYVERALGDYLHGASRTLEVEGLPAQHEPAAVEAVHRMVFERRYRGTGGLRDWFPRTLAAFDDGALRALVARFCASSAGATWREHRDGASLEEALFRFFEAEGIGEASVREDELLGAVVRALAVTPRAAFSLPAEVTKTALGFVAVTRGLVLHAAVGGQYVRGAVTPMIACLLRGDSISSVAEQFASEPNAVGMV
ncbi:MAG: DUF692 family protein, partial [Archangium sp.]|nr:DUF692 family protein [Archangium sp.]